MCHFTRQNAISIWFLYRSALYIYTSILLKNIYGTKHLVRIRKNFKTFHCGKIYGVKKKTRKLTSYQNNFEYSRPPFEDILNRNMDGVPQPREKSEILTWKRS